MRLLAIETSGAACSAALARDGDIAQRIELAPRRHAELLLPMIDGLLTDAGLALADLDAIAYGRGPGSFTGVRIAAAVAQGLAFGAGLPVIAVSTLAALAQGARRRHGDERVLAVLDARMGELYWGLFAADAAGLMRPVGAEQVSPPAAIRLPPGTRWRAVGSGWGAHGEALQDRLGDGRLAGGVWGDASDAAAEPAALDLAVLAADAWRRGEVQAAQDALPVYLRDRVAEPPRT